MGDTREDFSVTRMPFDRLIATPTGCVVSDLGSATVHHLNVRFTAQRQARPEQRHDLYMTDRAPYD